MQERKPVNGLFGTMTIAVTTGKATFDAASTTDIKEYVFRNTGIQKELVKHKRFNAALTDAPGYLAERLAAIRDLGNTLSTSFNDIYLRNLNLGLTNSDAKKETMKEINFQRDMGMKAIEAEYPTSITEKIIKDKLSIDKNKFNYNI
jgi:hypothetical protein